MMFLVPLRCLCEVLRIGSCTAKKSEALGRVPIICMYSTGSYGVHPISQNIGIITIIVCEQTSGYQVYSVIALRSFICRFTKSHFMRGHELKELSNIFLRLYIVNF